MAKILIILFIALIFEALGVVILKQGIDQITRQEKTRQGGVITVSVDAVLRLVGHGFINSRVLLGVLFEAIFFAGLLMLMGHKDVSFVWPLTSLSMVMATFAAIVLNNERVSGLRWFGVVVMMCGAAIIFWTEREKDLENNNAANPAATNMSEIK
jgi:drug/metabolite transporter (DMT)-like permease